MKALEAIFLDRDGTIMEDAHYIRSPEQVRLIPGAAQAVRRINELGIPAIIVTNQSGLARKIFSLEDYEAVRSHFESLLRAEGAHIDASYFCPHHPSVAGPCDCRKPATKMFEDALRDFQLDADRVAYVGDRWRDISAAKPLGGRGIMIRSPMTTVEDWRLARDDGFETADTLEKAVDVLLGLTESESAK